MTLLEAFLMGIVQGLTEFLPVSSSGHLAICSALFGINGEENMTFTMVVHLATVMATITVFWAEIVRVIRGVCKWQMNTETLFAINILISMVPIAFVGLCFQQQIEELLTPNLILIGCALLVTAALLLWSQKRAKRYESKHPITINGVVVSNTDQSKPLTPSRAFIIGIAQAIAVIPGLSRSGATISMGLVLGIKREEVSRFSFLMVLIPVIGMNLLELVTKTPTDAGAISVWALVVGGVAAYVVGALACRAMIRIVNRGKLHWFAIYCIVIGAVCLILKLA